MDPIRRLVLLWISLLGLYGLPTSLIRTYTDFNYRQISLTDTSGLLWVYWASWLVILILFFSIGIWCLIEDALSKDENQNEKENPHLSRRDILIARHDCVDAEVTRYRDLSWKIVAFAWAIYYGLNQFVLQANPKDSILFSYLPEKAFFIFIFLTAVSATIFLLYCEKSTIQNKQQRRELQEILILNYQWRFKPGGESILRFGFLVSVGIFIFMIWTPVLALFFFKK